jgi:hypothetical protein
VAGNAGFISGAIQNAQAMGGAEAIRVFIKTPCLRR